MGEQKRDPFDAYIETRMPDSWFADDPDSAAKCAEYDAREDAF